MGLCTVVTPYKLQVHMTKTYYNYMMVEVPPMRVSRGMCVLGAWATCMPAILVHEGMRMLMRMPRQASTRCTAHLHRRHYASARAREHAYSPAGT